MPERRRLITILFADVTGSTALGESLDPEDVRVLMGRYFAHLRPSSPMRAGSSAIMAARWRNSLAMR